MWHTLKKTIQEHDHGLPVVGDKPVPILDATDILKPFFRPLTTGQGFHRVVYAVTPNSSAESLRFAITLSQRGGMLLDVLQVTSYGQPVLSLMSILGLIDTMKINFRVTRRRGELMDEIVKYSLEKMDMASIVADVADDSRKAMFSQRRRLENPQTLGFPLLLLVNKGYLL